MKSRVLHFIPAWYIGWLTAILLLTEAGTRLWNAWGGPRTGKVLVAGDLSLGNWIFYAAIILVAYLCLRRSRLGYYLVLIIHSLIVLGWGILLFSDLPPSEAVFLSPYALASALSVVLLLRPSARQFFRVPGAGLLALPRGKAEFWVQGTIVAVIALGIASSVERETTRQPIRVWECGRTPGSGEIVGPINVTITPDGWLAVPFTARGEVRFYSPAGEVARVIEGLQAPTGVVQERSGLVVVAESSPPRLRWFDEHGVEVRSLAPPDLPLVTPGPIALGPKGTIYALDSSTRQIVAIAEDGRSSTVLPMEAEEPVAIAVGPTGDVWAALQERVVRLGVNGYEPVTARLSGAMVFTLAVPGDGPVLAAGVGSDGMSTLWRIDPDKRKTFKSSLGAVLPMAIAANGTSLFVYEPARCLLAEFQR